ncbi:MAG: LysM peptidoglycan-binding domain-containing protein [Candidatus Omnitrophica bacterium]|nr:LysM peptidoglycan-binding domain-containing protein [Candidatus Omnitrophota bacterium]
MKRFLLDTRYLILKTFATAFLIIYLAGCATAPGTSSKSPAPPTKPGIAHRVEKGQTLWGISKAYMIDLTTLADYNHISDSSRIEVGQIIIIPQQPSAASLQRNFNLDNFIWPIKGRVLVSFEQINNRFLNKGINIQASAKQEVLAAQSGIAAFCNDTVDGYGKTIIIEHAENLLPYIHEWPTS